MKPSQIAVLLVSVFIIAICGIVYELLISTMSSYFQGSSVLHFSLVIGLFLSAMGVGAYLSRFVHGQLLTWFIALEIALSLIGGSAAMVLYFAFSLTPYFYGITFSLIFLLGTLIGLEIPLLTRIVEQHDTLKNALANVLSFDYLGALLASVAFPLLLLPVLGTMRTAFAVGLLNVAVAALNTAVFRDQLRRTATYWVAIGSTATALVLGLAFSFNINHFFEQFLYRDEIFYTQQSAYQRIVMTRYHNDLRLYLDGNLQFASLDEHRYHEPLVHVPMLAAARRDSVLVLGGGDGLAVREILQYTEVKHIDLVDLDPAMTSLARNHPAIKALNNNALDNKKLTLYHEDAYTFVQRTPSRYDVVIIDLPDPNHPSLGKLYTHEFYTMVARITAAGGAIVTQSTSPYFAPDAFWCIHHTMESVFPNATLAYQTYLPSFGQWGFNLSLRAGRAPLPDANTIQQAVIQRFTQRADSLSLRYLQPALLPTLFVFDRETDRRPTDIQRLNDQPLLRYYEKGWQAGN